MLIDYVIVIFLLILSGLFSGLTLGLMSLNTFELKRKMKLGNADAKKVYPIRKKGNLLLCTLLLGNVAVNSALAIFLGSIASGVMAGIIATGLIVVFGEIVPQSIFSRYALSFGARSIWLVYGFLVVLYPVTKPISMVLDKFLGSELPTAYSKKEFLEILEEQKNIEESGISNRDFQILEGGLIYSHKKVEEIMTPRINTFFLKGDGVLDNSLISKILEKGNSRIPVYGQAPDKVIGILYAKDLIAVSKRMVRVKDVMRKKIHYIKETDLLGTVLSQFKKKRVHLFVVLDEFKGVAGIVTLEDVLEEIVGEIMDEYDVKKDMRK
jgi:metal transporter CNNM